MTERNEYVESIAVVFHWTTCKQYVESSTPIYVTKEIKVTSGYFRFESRSWKYAECGREWKFSFFSFVHDVLLSTNS